MELTKEQKKRVKDLRRMTPAEYDAICKRCGICCLSKLLLRVMDIDTRKCDEYTVYLRRCCNHFDTKTKQCRIYSNRFSAPNCGKVDIDMILTGDLLPTSCGYVEYVFGPSDFPAQVDFDGVRPIADEQVDIMPEIQLRREMIPESILWSRQK